MKLFNRLIAIVLAILTVFALAACGSSSNNVGGVDNENDKGGKDDKASTVEISDAIKSAMEKNKPLTQANYFFVEDGTILTLGGDSEKKYAGEYSKLTGVKQLIAGAGLSSFALTESGELYCRDAKIAENVSMMAYCTTMPHLSRKCPSSSRLRSRSVTAGQKSPWASGPYCPVRSSKWEKLRGNSQENSCPSSLV